MSIHPEGKSGFDVGSSACSERPSCKGALHGAALFTGMLPLVAMALVVTARGDFSNDRRTVEVCGAAYIVSAAAVALRGLFAAWPVSASGRLAARRERNALARPGIIPHVCSQRTSVPPATATEAWYHPYCFVIAGLTRWRCAA